MNHLASTLLTGVGATVLMDVWGLLRQPLLGQARPDYAMLGRWIGHMRYGRLRHVAIGKAPALRGERLLGWTLHYLTGIAFAGMLVGVCGARWLAQPTLLPALLFGLASLSAPFLLMQPAMGAGIAAARSADPGAARLQSLVTHLVFGLGLYAAALATRFLFPLPLAGE